MAGRLVHFELSAQDAERAKELWGSFFRWTLDWWDLLGPASPQAQG